MFPQGQVSGVLGKQYEQRDAIEEQAQEEPQPRTAAGILCPQGADRARHESHGAAASRFNLEMPVLQGSYPVVHVAELIAIGSLRKGICV